MNLPSLPFTKLEIITWLFALVRAFLYSFIIAASAMDGMDMIPPQWKMWSKLFVIQAGAILMFLDSTISKLQLFAQSAPQPPLPPNVVQLKDQTKIAS